MDYDKPNSLKIIKEIDKLLSEEIKEIEKKGLEINLEGLKFDVDKLIEEELRKENLLSELIP